MFATSVISPHTYLLTSNLKPRNCFVVFTPNLSYYCFLFKNRFMWEILVLYKNCDMYFNMHIMHNVKCRVCYVYVWSPTTARHWPASLISHHQQTTRRPLSPYPPLTSLALQLCPLFQVITPPPSVSSAIIYLDLSIYLSRTRRFTDNFCLFQYFCFPYCSAIEFS